MSLVRRFMDRLRRHGPFMTVNLTLKYLFGINLINGFNAVRFREFKIVTSCDISTLLPGSTVLPHPIGIVVGHGVEVGENVRIQQNATLGRADPEPDAGYPTVGDDVRIGAGAVVMGEVTIGDGAVVGANSVVLDDVRAGATVVGAPAAEP